MPLAVGTKLGAYEILALVGSGGMGEVYRARDSALGRDIAIKVLPPEVSDEPERLARFRREAKLLASLNHPNIAAIYGFEEAEGRPFLVMELVEGEDLSRRLSRGRIPLDDATGIARQMAEALEAAHEKGIIHRDLKPANVVVNEEGQVKILDFGLAKAFAGDTADGSSPELSQSPTVSRHQTAMGVILGTAAYMSPEQARGKAVDRRADIWAFGVVLFEMLTGRTLFSGDTVSDVLASVLRAELDWAQLPDETPPAVRRLMRRCLVREPKHRLRDMGDARLELAETEEATTTNVRPIHPVVYAALLLIGVVAGLGITLLFSDPAREPAPVRRATLKLDRPLAVFSRGDRTALALSPDGSHLVYRAWAKDPIGPLFRLYGSEKDDTLLYLRRLDEHASTPIAGTDGAYVPFFSPDGEWIGFFKSGKLMKVPVSGGVPTTITDAPDSWGAVWAPDGTIIFNPRAAEGFHRVPDSGGEASVLTSLDLENEEQEHNTPYLLPDGDTLLFRTWNDRSGRVEAMSLRDGQRKMLVADSGSYVFALESHLAYVSQSLGLVAAPFDASTTELLGPPQPVLTGLLREPIWGAAQVASSRNGTLVYAAGGTVAMPAHLVWIDRDGEVERVDDEARAFDKPRLSPDGRRIVYATYAGAHDVWVYDLTRATHNRLTSSDAAVIDPLWTPDGEQIVFSSSQFGGINLTTIRADGTGAEEPLGEPASERRAAGNWTPDGEFLVLQSQRADFGLLLFEREDASYRPLLDTPANEQYPRLSPDGRWLAFQTDVSGRTEIHVARFPEPAATHPISDTGGRFPLWSKRGDDYELFYESLDGRKLMAVSIRTEPALEAGIPRVLFEKAVHVEVFDVDRGAERFLGVDRQEPPPVTELQVIFNWGEELKQKVPIR